MSESDSVIHVYAHWKNFSEPRLLGNLYVERTRGSELISFEYDREWLSSSEARNLDPDLQLFRGRQYKQADRTSFGLFLDSAPDRWGRLLMRRRESIDAGKENRRPRFLSECDFLLGVHDTTRMGALRFKTDENGPFLAEDLVLAVPPWARLRKLEQAAVGFESEGDGQLEEMWLNLLLAPGSSLGGARPKASVIDPSGALWIAKFPSKNDEEDVGSWEMVVHDLAVNAGLKVPEAKVERFSRSGSTFLVRRFDRTEKYERIHFASAMTLLGKIDGASAQDGSSYLELAQLIISAGAEPKEDLEELWKRIVFNIAVSNTDDHLRNHGFLLEHGGWRISPLYDVNPNPQGRGLSLNISEDDNSLDFNLALKVAPYFQIEPSRAEKLLKQVHNVVSEWKEAASSYGLSRSSIERMQWAFRRD